MIQLHSKTGIVKGKQEVVYAYISDFRNFAHMLPAEQLQNLDISGDTLKFGISGLGTVGLKIAAREPSKQLIIKATEDSSADFTFWINIDAASGNESQVNLTLEANLNLFMEMMAKAPLQKFVDLIIDKLTTLEFSA